MSIYTVNEVCWRLVHDPAFRAAVQRDPADALEREDLTGTERAALLSGDVARLHHLGAHDFLLGHLGRYGIAGLTVPIFIERMRSVADDAAPAAEGANHDS